MLFSTYLSVESLKIDIFCIKSQGGRCIFPRRANADYCSDRWSVMMTGLSLGFYQIIIWVGLTLRQRGDDTSDVGSTLGQPTLLSGNSHGIVYAKTYMPDSVCLHFCLDNLFTGSGTAPQELPPLETLETEGIEAVNVNQALAGKSHTHVFLTKMLIWNVISQQTHYAIMTSLFRQTTSVWRNYVKMTSF